MKNKIELLAPSGSWDAFLAAVENGADAVYLGGKLHNARQFAENFDSDNLQKAIEYAHVRDVNVYLTLNTLISDREMEEAVEFCKEAYLLGIDGVIVQDLGFASLIRKNLPDLDLHASTQMTIYNLEGVKALESLGFKRVILARELSLEEIRHITSNTNVEIEVFVHGALCVCYSGQCLMSSIIGGRSGNRGKCAQPCRMPYTLVRKTREPVSFEKGSYLLSPKDMSTINDIGDIIRSGVKSLKIEGRMKSAEYVATVVGIYRKYIDIASSLGEGEKLNVDDEDRRDLLRIFNRGGFSKGYFFGKSPDMMAYESPKNQGIYIGKALSSDLVRGTFRIKLEDRLSTGDGIEIRKGEKSSGTVVSSIIKNGLKVDTAKAGETVEVGFLKEAMTKGDKVYKTYDKELEKSARKSFEGRYNKKVELFGKVTVELNKPAILEVWDNAGNSVTIMGDVASEAAINKPLTQELLAGQLGKTGSTPFVFKKIEADIKGSVSLPVSEINSIRRKGLSEMEKLRSKRYPGRQGKEIIMDIVTDGDRESVNNTNRGFGFNNRQLHMAGVKLQTSGKSVQIAETGSFEIKSKGNIAYMRGETGLSGIKSREKTGISLFLFNHKGINFIDPDADRVYLPFSLILDSRRRVMLDKYLEKYNEVFLYLPPITRGNYDSLIKSNIGRLASEGIKGILAGNPGSIAFVRDIPDIKIMGDFTLNPFNSFSLGEYKKMGLDGITLSVELTFRQIQEIDSSTGLEKEIIAYGYLPLMTSEYCPLGSIVCGAYKSGFCRGVCEEDTYYLKDRMGICFPVISNRIDCRSAILNSNVLFVPEAVSKAKEAGIDSIRINVFDEEPEEIHQIVSYYRLLLGNGKDAAARYDDVIKNIELRGFTKGHYFRGV